MTDVRLPGLAPEPLGSCLAALGTFRVVAEQGDPAARARWDGDTFVLRSRFDADALVAFLADQYRPSPVVAPWNGGSGFHPKDNRDALDAIESSTSARLSDYRETIARCRAVLAQMGLDAKPDAERKLELLESLRADLPESALPWLDAAVVLTSDAARYPALLGTGGNDGRLDFTNNQMQRVADVVLTRDRESSVRLLRAALLGDAEPGLERDIAVGQFNPAAAGGPNAGAGFTRESLVNGWSYVLMIEGALLFAGAATRRWEGADRESFAYPFSVRPTGAGYASADASDEASPRGETWVPLWDRPKSLPEVRALFGEGRATLADPTTGNARNARNGVEFARAVAGLGVDRGVREFVRFGFQERNGLAFIANPLGRWRVERRPAAALLEGDLAGWIEGLRRRVDDHTPASVARALRRIQTAVLDLCRDDGPAVVQELLVALGAAEQALARSVGFRTDKSLAPVPALRSAQWHHAADDGSVEYRLAWSLATSGIRESLVPVRWAHPRTWLANDDLRTVWRAGALDRNLLRVVARDDIDSERGSRPESPHGAAHRAALRGPDARGLDPRIPGEPVTIPDLAAFVRGDVDDARIEALARGLALVAPPGPRPAAAISGRPPHVPFVLALVLAAHRLRAREDDVDAPFARTPGLVAALVAGDGLRATRLAARRLRGAGYPPWSERTADGVVVSPDLARRCGAALAFPVASADIQLLLTHVQAPARRPEEE